MGHYRLEADVDMASWLPLQITYFDDKGDKVKSIQLFDIKQVDGVWTPSRIEAIDYGRKHRTVFTYTEIDYVNELKDRLFAVNQLGKAAR